MSWVDEYWKGAKAQADCTPTIRDPDFSPKNCKLKAHVTCGNWDASTHDICGAQPICLYGVWDQVHIDLHALLQDTNLTLRPIIT